MKYNNPLQSIAFAMYDCSNYLTYDDAKQNKVHWSDCCFWLFQQVWGSTSCGFGGIAGQAVTTADTVIVMGPKGDCCVYISGRLAYYVERPNEQFYEDLHKHDMKGKADNPKYEKY